MVRISVPQSDGQIIVTEGGEPTVYKVKDGVITVDDAHIAGVLGAVSGSELKPEAPVKEK